MTSPSTIQTVTAIPSAPSSPVNRYEMASPYSRVVRVARQVKWDIDADVIRGRKLDTAHHYLPDGLSRISRMPALDRDERRFLSQIQGRTYANIFGLVERYINAKVLELSRDYVFSDQIALEGLIRFSQDEIKHQELFRRVEKLAAEAMPVGYTFQPNPDEVAKAVLAADTWSVLALTLHIELFTQAHYRESIEPDASLSPLFKDVFLYHWKEEAQHAAMDEIELRRVDATLTEVQRDQAVTHLINLVVAVDGILQRQSVDDARYFANAIPRVLTGEEQQQLQRDLLAAYRWQYILSGAEHPVFLAVLTELVNENQAKRILAALSTLR